MTDHLEAFRRMKEEESRERLRGHPMVYRALGYELREPDPSERSDYMDRDRADLKDDLYDAAASSNRHQLRDAPQSQVHKIVRGQPMRCKGQESGLIGICLACGADPDDDCQRA